MKKSPYMVAAAAAVLLTGCIVTSVYPYYAAKDLSFDPALVGSWTKTEDADEHWKFEPDGTNAYRLTFSSKSETNVMQAHLFKLHNERFLDLFTTDEMKDIQPPPIPSHFVLRIFQMTPSLRMASMNYEWLGETLTNNPHAVRHLVIRSTNDGDDGRIVLTADTPELQKFLVGNLKAEKAWKDVIELNRDAPAAK
jgi:hypothetical protein